MVEVGIEGAICLLLVSIVFWRGRLFVFLVVNAGGRRRSCGGFGRQGQCGKVIFKATLLQGVQRDDSRLFQAKSNYFRSKENLSAVGVTTAKLVGAVF
jgi:hypothetical protein